MFRVDSAPASTPLRAALACIDALSVTEETRV
jgi:hypothetical protein